MGSNPILIDNGMLCVNKFFEIEEEKDKNNRQEKINKKNVAVEINVNVDCRLLVIACFDMGRINFIPLK